MDCGIIILAAGASTRMGQSKQLLLVDGKSLLLRAATIALEANAQKTIIVLGAGETQHRSALTSLPIEIVVNTEWNKGMGSSIKTGLQYLQEQPSNIDEIIIMVCDQPYVTADHLKVLQKKSVDTDKQIVASFYNGSPGVPALFKKTIFPQLLSLDDAHGAKRIIQRNEAITELIAFPKGSVDLDTPEDYRNFLDHP